MGIEVIDGSPVETFGSGPPLVLLHGLGGPLIWERLAAMLATEFLVIIPHLPGFGDSAPPATPLSEEMHVAFVAGVLTSMNIPRAAVAGTSYGGEIAALLAEREPERVERLILINSTGLVARKGIVGALLERPWFRRFLTALLGCKQMVCLLGALSFHDRSKRPKTLCDRFFAQVINKRDSWVAGMRNVFSGRAETARIVARNRTRTLVIWGEFDRMARRKTAPFSGVTIAGAGHSLPLERPHELFLTMRNFMRREVP